MDFNRIPTLFFRVLRRASSFLVVTTEWAIDDSDGTRRIDDFEFKLDSESHFLIRFRVVGRCSDVCDSDGVAPPETRLGLAWLGFACFISPSVSYDAIFSAQMWILLVDKVELYLNVEHNFKCVVFSMTRSLIPIGTLNGTTTTVVWHKIKSAKVTEVCRPAAYSPHRSRTKWEI